MELKRISKGEMPPANKYVLIYCGDRPWIDSEDDPKWKVAKCVYGISMEQREKLKKSDSFADIYRGSVYRSEDEWGNNLVPYCFEEFGPGSFFGQEIDIWCELPEIMLKRG